MAIVGHRDYQGPECQGETEAKEMTPYYSRDGITIFCGDCLEVMPQLEPVSFDSIITDPPYGLRFMGKEWDHGLPSIPFWEATLRVAKPGAMLLAFGGSRTYHRLTCAIEDAGWEIRDCLMWIYGQGFPKSRDISKAIDEAAGAEREVVGKSYARGMRGCTDRNFEQGARPYINGKPNQTDYPLITAPATDAAKLWDGWGTALKPAYEPIVLAMKPLDGTFATNALEWGTAGLWIDGGRVETNDDLARVNGGTNKLSWGGTYGAGPNNAAINGTQGRWPANVILSDDEEVLAGFPVTKSYASSPPVVKSDDKSIFGYGGNVGQKHGEFYGKPNNMTAARFFYCAKASRRERGDGNNHPTVKPLSLVQYLCRLTKTPTGGIILDPFMGSGTTLLAARTEGRQVVGIELSEDYCKIAVERLEHPFVSIPRKHHRKSKN